MTVCSVYSYLSCNTCYITCCCTLHLVHYAQKQFVAISSRLRLFCALVASAIFQKQQRRGLQLGPWMYMVFSRMMLPDCSQLSSEALPIPICSKSYWLIRCSSVTIWNCKVWVHGLPRASRQEVSALNIWASDAVWNIFECGLIYLHYLSSQTLNQVQNKTCNWLDGDEKHFLHVHSCICNTLKSICNVIALGNQARINTGAQSFAGQC